MSGPRTLDEAWQELELDALASDGPIRDRDVREAIARQRPRIEAAVAASFPTVDEWSDVILDALLASNNGDNPFSFSDPDVPDLARELAEAVTEQLRKTVTP